MSPFVEQRLIDLCEATFAVLPRRHPSREQLAGATIVAHRGERDGVRVRENTLAAFDPAVAAGVGAIEFDVRYTRDDEPVISHDATFERVFGDRKAVAELSWRELRARLPDVPHLDEVLARYASRVRLMIELKTRGTPRAEARFASALEGLVPARDFYFLSLDTTLFAACAAWPAAARIPVAKLNWRALARWTKTHPNGGIAGPFLFIRKTDIARQDAADALIGSGFIRLRGLMLREIGRGIPWIFTNRPVALQAMLDRERARAGC